MKHIKLFERYINDRKGELNCQKIINESKFKVNDKWEWNTSDGFKIVRIISIKPNGDVVGRVEGDSQDFIIRDANKYLKKKIK
jgi:hypothetical protein